MTNKVPEEWGNNFYKSGWQPGLEVNESTGQGEITHVGTDPNFRNKYEQILRDWGFEQQFEQQSVSEVSEVGRCVRARWTIYA